MSRTAVLFDLDGVLWNSAEAHDAAFRAVLAPHGIVVPAYAKIAGRRTDEVIRELLTRAGMQAGRTFVDELVAQKRALSAAALRASPPIAPDCRALLDLLAPRYRMGIGSSASRSSVDLFIAALGAPVRFEATVSGEEVAHGKPAPDIYLEVMRRMNVAAHNATVIEDAPAGIASARAAGARAIGITTTATRDALLDAGADAVVGALTEIPGVL